jgi:hypothetical protein
MGPKCTFNVEGQDFTNFNHLLQRALAQESRAKEHKVHNRFRKNNVKEKSGVNCVGEDLVSDDDVDECVAEWVDASRVKSLAFSFLKPSPERRDEMKCTFDVMKCDKLFDLLLQSSVIRLSENHIVPTLDQIAKGKYCKWHGTFSHNTNDCNYFHWQVQSAINDERLILGSSNKTKLDVDPFPANVNMINYEEKRVLVWTSKAGCTRGKNAIVSDGPYFEMSAPRREAAALGIPRAKMIKLKSLEPGVWKDNLRYMPRNKVHPTSNMLLENMHDKGGAVCSKGSRGTRGVGLPASKGVTKAKQERLSNGDGYR